MSNYIKSITVCFLLLFSIGTKAVQDITTTPLFFNLSVCGGSDTVKVEANFTGGETAVSVKVYLPAGLIYDGGHNIIANAGLVLSTSPLVGTKDSLEFLFTDTAQASTLNIQFLVKSDCELLGGSQANMMSKLAFVPFGGGSTQTIQSLLVSFGKLFPALDLSQVAEGNDLIIRGTKGDTLVRTIDLKNTGNDYTSNIEFKVLYLDSVVLDLLDLEISNNNLSKPINFSSYVKSNDTITYTFNINSTDLAAIGLNSGLGGLTSGESMFRVRERAIVKKCSPNSVVNTHFEAMWLCNGFACGNVAETSVAYLQQIDASEVTLTRTNLTPANYTVPGSIKYEISNNSKHTINTVSVAPLSSSDISITSITTKINGNIETNPFIGPITIDSINANTVVEIEYSYILLCDTVCGINGGQFFTNNVSYYGECIVAPFNLSDDIRDNESIIKLPRAFGGVDLVSGAPYKTFGFELGLVLENKILTKVCDSEDLLLELKLPQHVKYDSSSVSYKDTLGTVYSLPSNNNSQLITINLSSLPDGGKNGTFYVDLRLDYSCVNSGVKPNDFEEIQWSLKYNCFSGSCSRTLACDSWEYFAHYSCDLGTGTGSGGINGGATCNIITDNFTATRITLGNEQSATVFQNTIPTPKVSITDTLLNLKAAYEADTIQVKLEGLLSDSCYVDGDRLHVHITYSPPTNINDTNNLLSIIPSSVVLMNNDTAIITASSIKTSSVPNSNVILFDISFPNDTILAGTIDLTANFVINKNFIGGATKHLLKRFRGEWLYDFANTNNLPVYGNLTWGDAFHIYRPIVTVLEDSRLLSADVCSQDHIIALKISGANLGEDFPNEFRPVASFDEIKYKLVQGYSYTPNSSVIEVYDGEITGSPVFTQIIQNPTITGNAFAGGELLTWQKTALWPIVDKSVSQRNIVVRFGLTPDCSVDLGNNFTANIKHTEYEYASPVLVNDTLTTLDLRTLPNLFLANVDMIYTSGQTADFVFYVSNTSVKADSVWLAFNSNDQLKLLDLKYDSGNSNFVSYGGINYNGDSTLYAQIGTVSGQSQRLKLTVEFTTCDSAQTEFVKMFMGWNCNGYPSINAAFNPLDTLNSCGPIKQGSLGFTKEQSFIRVQLLKPAIRDFKAFCQPASFEVLFSAPTGNIALDSLVMNAAFPQGILLANVNNVYAELNGDSVFLPINLAGLLNPQNGSWNIYEALPTNRLQAGEYVKVYFDIIATCDYAPTSTLNISANAKTPCGTDVFSDASLTRVPLQGLEEIGNTSLTIIPGPYSSPYATALQTVRVTNSSGTTLTGLKLEVVVMKNNNQYIGVEPGTPVPSVLSLSDRYILQFNNFSITGAYRDIKFKIKDLSPVDSCKTFKINTKLITDKKIACAGGDSCEIYLESPVTSRTVSMHCPIPQVQLVCNFSWNNTGSSSLIDTLLLTFLNSSNVTLGIREITLDTNGNVNTTIQVPQNTSIILPNLPNFVNPIDFNGQIQCPVSAIPCVNPPCDSTLKCYNSDSIAFIECPTTCNLTLDYGDTLQLSSFTINYLNNNNAVIGLPQIFALNGSGILDTTIQVTSAVAGISTSVTTSLVTSSITCPIVCIDSTSILCPNNGATCTFPPCSTSTVCVDNGVYGECPATCDLSFNYNDTLQLPSLTLAYYIGATLSKQDTITLNGSGILNTPISFPKAVTSIKPVLSGLDPILISGTITCAIDTSCNIPGSFVCRSNPDDTINCYNSDSIAFIECPATCDLSFNYSDTLQLPSLTLAYYIGATLSKQDTITLNGSGMLNTPISFPKAVTSIKPVLSGLDPILISGTITCAIDTSCNIPGSFVCRSNPDDTINCYNSDSVAFIECPATCGLSFNYSDTLQLPSLTLAYYIGATLSKQDTITLNGSGILNTPISFPKAVTSIKPVLSGLDPILISGTITCAIDTSCNIPGSFVCRSNSDDTLNCYNSDSVAFLECPATCDLSFNYSDTLQLPSLTLAYYIGATLSKQETIALNGSGILNTPISFPKAVTSIKPVLSGLDPILISGAITCVIDTTCNIPGSFVCRPNANDTINCYNSDSIAFIECPIPTTTCVLSWEYPDSLAGQSLVLNYLGATNQFISSDTIILNNTGNMFVNINLPTTTVNVAPVLPVNSNQFTFSGNITCPIDTNTGNPPYGPGCFEPIAFSPFGLFDPQCDTTSIVLPSPSPGTTIITCSDCIESFSPIPGQKYILSAWIKVDAAVNTTDYSYKDVYVELEFEGIAAPGNTIQASPSGLIIDGWQRIEKEFLLPVNSVSIITKLKNDGASQAYFDDIRIHPVNGNMKSFVYDPINLRLVAELDENNYATFYEYDEEGALIRVKKETAKGIQTIQESRNHTKGN